MTNSKQKQVFNLDYHKYNMNDLDELLITAPFVKNNKKLEYMNIPVTFDIETTSFYEGNEKRACMYAFVFTINGKGLIARTWHDFLFICKKLVEHYELNLSRRVIIWVHNLSFEFSFLQHYFTWENVFAVDSRKPVYAVTNDGLEFRCSYILSGYSLEMVSKNLVYYKVNKMVGDLDYKKYRHSKTPLTDKELGYILNDGLVVGAYIQELLDQYGDFHKIPLTNTGFIRKYVRKETLYGGVTSHKKGGKQYIRYRNLMQSLIIPSYPCYLQMKQCYTGGFTHCNALYNDVIIDNVASFDFTSSYPAVMVYCKFPMSTPKMVKVKSLKEFQHYLDTKCCMFNIQFTNIRPKLFQDHPISVSKCLDKHNVVEDNGRLVTADSIVLVINEVDFEVIRSFYEWDEIKVYNFRIMDKTYLPKEFINAILTLYEEKTTLKGSTDIDDMIRYLQSKGHLNGCYGMCVTDIVQMVQKFENGIWTTEEPDIEQVFQNYNNSKSRFLYYAWGIWVTSHARYNLFTGIKACGKDYIYSDTDSIKIRNYQSHLGYIKRFNEWVDDRLKAVCDFYSIDINRCYPKDIKGNVHPLGYWDFEGTYKRFKTLGAKRYMYEDNDGVFHLTCSGVSKKAINYLCDGLSYDIKTHKPSFNVFDKFKMGLYIPSYATGKNTHTYIDDYHTGYLTDYLGKTAKYEEFSGVHLEGADYSLTLSSIYIEYLLSVHMNDYDYSL